LREEALDSLGGYDDPRAEARIREVLESGDPRSVYAASSAIDSWRVRHDFWKDSRFDDALVRATARPDLLSWKRLELIREISDARNRVKGWLEVVRHPTRENEEPGEQFLMLGDDDRSALPVLEEAASNDPNDRVRAAARQALEHLRKRYQEEEERERRARARRGK